VWNILKALGNFYLYSSLHISLCAALICIESYLILGIEIQWYYALYIGLSTMAVYSAHRLVGMSMVSAFSKQGRYRVIKKYRHHILVYFCLSFILAVFFFFELDFRQMVMIVIPAILTTAYVLPLFNSKRLRDFPFIKIFLIAIVWTWLTLGMISTELFTPLCAILLIERVLFFLAITIPFDIRDVIVDESISVKTLIHKLGIKKSKLLALALVIICFCLISYLFFTGLINQSYFYGLSICYVYVAVLIYFSKQGRGDFFFGGLLDGSIGLRLVLYLSMVYLTTN